MSNSSQSLDPETDLSAEEILQIQGPISMENPISTHDEEQQKSQPQSPQTLITPKTQDHQNPEKSNTNLEDPQIMEQEEQESSGMVVSNRPSFTTNNTYCRNLSKRGAHKKQQTIYKKAQNLLKNLNLNPFVPTKILDFLKYEKLLRRLGLWDFVHIEFGKSIKADLVAQLIVSFDITKKCSYVNGFRFAVNRTDLARALKLPLPAKKEKEALVVDLDLDLDWEHSSEECVSFVEDFVSGWVLLHGEAWMMPSEVGNWMRLIKSGHPEKVDWASFFWHMVESELKQGVQLGSCYYASHLQCLIKSKREELLREAPKVEMELEEVKQDEDLLREEAGKVELEVVEVKEDEELLREEAGKVELEVVEVKADEELLREEPRKVELDVEVEEVKENKELSREEAEKVELVVEELNKDKDGGLNESSRGKHNVVLEEPTIELSLGHQDTVEKEEMKEDIVEKEEMKVDDMMDVEECKDEKRGHFSLAEKNNVSKHFLQPCILGEGGGFDGNDERKQEVEQVEVEEDMKAEEEGVGRGSDGDERIEEVEQMAAEEEGEQFEVAEDEVEEVEAEDEVEEVEVEDEVEEVEVEVEEEGQLEENEEEEDGIGCNIAPNYGSIEGADLTGDLLQGFGTSQLPLNLQGQQLHEHSSMELFVSNAETQLIMGGPSIFDNDHKRLMDYEQDASHLNGNNKRMRTTVEWDHKSSNFGSCMGQVEQLMEKAKIIYEEKEQAFQELNMNQQYLLHELQQRESLIQNLQKSKNEELQKKEVRIFRLERELCLMGTLLDGYRKALKETNKNFFDYRQRCQLPEEPIYKDAGPQGLVLSITELEKQRENQEREDRLKCLMIEQHANEAFEGYIGKFEVLLLKVQMLDTNRLTSMENEVKLLKELSAAKRKASETAGCVPGD